MRKVSVAAICAVAGCVALHAQSTPAPDFEKLPFAPRRAICYRTATPLQIDGTAVGACMDRGAVVRPFIDIDGTRHPPLATRVKMLWDDEFLYFGADLEEPHLWGTLEKRDAVIFQDNDFEIFIDPDGDTHAYFEIEINALNTVWDLLLIQPYRDGGPAIHAWDIAGLRTAVDLRGTHQPAGRSRRGMVDRDCHPLDDARRGGAAARAAACRRSVARQFLARAVAARRP